MIKLIGQPLGIPQNLSLLNFFDQLDFPQFLLGTDGVFRLSPVFFMEFLKIAIFEDDINTMMKI